MIQFIRQPGGQINEQVTVSKRIKPADIQVMNVILDYKEKKIEKCVIEGKVLDQDWDKMNNYYKRIYPALITQLESTNGESKA
ncbi:MAG: hypothetical protein ACOVLB_01250 [Candidatus Nanopelagicus sp.]